MLLFWWVVMGSWDRGAGVASTSSFGRVKDACCATSLAGRQDDGKRGPVAWAAGTYRAKRRSVGGLRSAKRTLVVVRIACSCAVQLLRAGGS